MNRSSRLSAQDVLRRYVEEDLPDFFEIKLTQVNQRGISGDTPLCVASIRGNIDELEALMAGGADKNLAGEMGCTPLHYAASQGHLAIVRRLLEVGADFGIRNEFGDSVRDAAVRAGHSEVVAELDKWDL